MNLLQGTDDLPVGHAGIDQRLTESAPHSSNSVCGARSIIRANALVTLGTKIASGSLVLGLPAKVVRQLAPNEQKDIANQFLCRAG